MNSISEKLTDAIIKKKLIPLEMRDWYIYAFLRILETSLSTITILIIGYMESKIVPTICFWLFFCELRKQTGGFHCKKYWECYLVTSLLMYIYISIEKYFSAYPIMIYLCLIISAIVIMYIGSINNPNMNLSKNEIMALNEYSRAAEPPVRCGESHMSGLTGATLLHLLWLLCFGGIQSVYLTH